MQGIVFLGDRTLELQDFPDPTPGPDEAVVEIKASGMCGTDLHYFRGPKNARPIIAGHEPCGIVAAVGTGVAAAQAAVGDRVMVHHYEGCRVCNHCRAGWTQMCAEGSIVYGNRGGHGAHAHYMKIPAHTLVKLPEALSYKTGAAISCGTGTAFGALKRLDLAGDETVAIFGQGPVGLSATQLAKAMGARVIALDIKPERRALASQFGADAVIDPTAVDAVAAIRDLTAGAGAHKTLECASSAEARRQAVQCVRPWGSACMVGIHGRVDVDVNDLIFRQINVVGSWTFSKNGQADCADFVTERGIDVEALFSHEFRLNQAEEAYRLFDSQEVGKGVFML